MAFNKRKVIECGSMAVTLSILACAPNAFGPLRPATPAAVPRFVWSPDVKPVVSSGRAGWPVMPVDPNVYVDDEGFHLFYSTLFCPEGETYRYSWDPGNPTRCDIAKPITAIAYAFSRDRGLTWEFRKTPVAAPGATGFDAGRVETASAFRMGDTLYLAYSADGEREGRILTARYQIGLARLRLAGQSVRNTMMDETRHFERQALPLLPFSLEAGRFDNNVQEPSVVVRPEGLVLFYVGLGLKLPDQPIDVPGQGVTEMGLGRALLDRQFNVITRSERPILTGVNMAEVRQFDNLYHLFATTLSPPTHKNESLVYASSGDGETWSVPEVIVGPGPTPGFNDWGVMAPTAAPVADSLVLLYTTYGTEPGECRLIGPTGRFGVPLSDASRCMYVTVGRATSPRQK